MSSMILFASSAAMATTQLARTNYSEKLDVWNTEYIAVRKQPLRMSWVVVTDETGKRQLRMRWKFQDGS